jgi:hypothetical protein
MAKRTGGVNGPEIGQGLQKLSSPPGKWFSFRFAIRADDSAAPTRGRTRQKPETHPGVATKRKLILPALIAVAFSVPALAQTTPAPAAASTATKATTSSMSQQGSMEHKTAKHHTRHHHHHAKKASSKPASTSTGGK